MQQVNLTTADVQVLEQLAYTLLLAGMDRAADAIYSLTASPSDLTREHAPALRLVSSNP
jgi:hypothetical protein